jgi:hypothetical protein
MIMQTLTPEQVRLLHSYVPKAYEFKESFDRRFGYKPTDYAGTVPRSKTAAKRDKFALKALRSNGINPTELPGYFYRIAGLVNNLPRF